MLFYFRAKLLLYAALTERLFGGAARVSLREQDRGGTYGKGLKQDAWYAVLRGELEGGRSPASNQINSRCDP